MTIPQAIQTALQHHQAGRLKEAESIYRQVLALDPNNPDALHLLGVIAFQASRFDVAVDLITRAVGIAPHMAEFHGNLGLALGGMKKYDQALACFQRAIAIRSLNPEVHNDMGHLLSGLGRTGEAEAAFRTAIAQNANFATAWANLGNLLRETGREEESLAACEKALAIDPGSAIALTNLGNIFQQRGRLAEAAAQYEKAVTIAPNVPQIHNNLGSALCRMHHVAEGIRCYQKALKLQPAWPEALTNLATALRDMDRGEASMAAVRRALAIDPNYYEAHHTLGNLLKDAGELDGAIAEYRRAAELRPGSIWVDSNLAYLIHYHPGYDGPAILEQLRQWNRRYSDPVKRTPAAHQNDRSPDRRLRIGYVSPNFSAHCFGRNMLPLYREQNRAEFEAFFYSDYPGADDFTRRIRGFSDGWRDTADLSDQAMADMIRADGIDILVDHTMHMAHTRLLVFARKPAPVQVTFGAYPAGTGMAEMDCRFSDPHLDPPEFEGHYAEQTIRLADTFWCYDVEGMSLADTPEVDAPPICQTGNITFGCLNNFCKVNPGVLELWRRVLDAVPGSRLMVMAPAGLFRRDLSKFFSDRIDFVNRQQRRAYYELYGRIDIGLDTFPYNGHTTSLDSFWMGVPIVTLIGRTAVGRAGLSQLSNLELSELAADTPERFIEIATGLAGNIPRLTELRASLRERMRASPLMDAARFARNVEAAYRRMWRQWTNP